MEPLYCTCPFCGHPAVVRGYERAFARRCRQCAKAYTPGRVKAQEDEAPAYEARGERALAAAAPARRARRRAG